MGIPACLIAIWLIGRFGSRFLNIMGFSLLSLLFLAMAIVWTVNEDLHMLLFVIFCAITFCLTSARISEPTCCQPFVFHSKSGALATEFLRLAANLELWCESLCTALTPVSVECIEGGTCSRGVHRVKDIATDPTITGVAQVPQILQPILLSRGCQMRLVPSFLRVSI